MAQQGELICFESWDEVHRATLPKKIQDTTEDQEDEMLELHKELQAGLIFSPPLGRVELADTGTMTLGRDQVHDLI